MFKLFLHSTCHDMNKLLSISTKMELFASRNNNNHNKHLVHKLCDNRTFFTLKKCRDKCIFIRNYIKKGKLIL